MRRRVFRSVAVTALVLLALPMAASARAGEQGPSRYIVTLGDGAGDVSELAAELLAGFGAGELVASHDSLGVFVVDLHPALAPALGALPGVAGVEADRLVRRTTTQDDPPWGLDRIDQRQRPLSGTYEYDATGAGVDAYIIDSGINAAHVDFGGRVADGHNSHPSHTDTSDCDGHGTHVAGTVGGATYGVAKAVTLIPVRIFGCEGSTSTSVILDAIDWVIGEHDPGEPAVANMSFGTTGGPSNAMDDAVRALIADGVTVAVAAGNAGADECTTSSPSRVGEALVVGATDRDDARASFSNFGSCLDLHAPGADVLSASHSSTSGATSLSGTSMAAPHVAGTAALYLAGDPAALPATVHSAVVDAATGGAVTGIKTDCTVLDDLLGTCMRGTTKRLLHTDFDAPPSTGGGGGGGATCSPLRRLLGTC